MIVAAARILRRTANGQDLYDLLPEEVDARAPPAAATKHRFLTIPIKAVSTTVPTRYPHGVPVSATDAALTTRSAHAVVVDYVPVLLARQSERRFALEPRCVTARVRLSAGRQQLGDGVQALCFLAGANSIFYGDKLLTTGNTDAEADVTLRERLGMSRSAPEVR